MGKQENTDLRVMTNAQRWLNDLLRTANCDGPTATLRTPCYVVLGSWIASSSINLFGATENTGATFNQTAILASELINRAERDSYRDTLDPGLLLLVEVLLASRGLKVPALRNFMRQACDVLSRDEPALLADQSLFEKRMLLSRLGLLPRPATSPSHNLKDLLTALPLTASPGQIEEALVMVECVTGWGTQASAIGHYESWMREKLEGFAAYRLKQNDLSNATRLLRSAAYLEGRHVQGSRSDLYSYLRSLQNAHGAFGFFGQEEVELHKIDSDSNADVELYLPATVSCVWTFAETAHQGWRLLDSMPEYLYYP